ncbi:hypothetical protein ACWCXX_40685 [Streptomyces sp. NPDC001732]
MSCTIRELLPRTPDGRWTGFGPAVAVPIGSGRTVHGVLLLVRREGRPVLGTTETRPPADFAGHVAVAMELADRRQKSEQVAQLRERERIFTTPSASLSSGCSHRVWTRRAPSRL